MTIEKARIGRTARFLEKRRDFGVYQLSGEVANNEMMRMIKAVT